MYNELEVALPADLSVSEKVLYFFTWGQVLYLVVGILAAMAVVTWVPLPIDYKPSISLMILMLSLLVAMVRPAGRDITVWFLVLLLYLRREHLFVWHKEPSLRSDGSPTAHAPAYKPRMRWSTER
jgi:Ca2+/Na+ antiporter